MRRRESRAQRGRATTPGPRPAQEVPPTLLATADEVIE
jgi:hypothetical protein